ncbi:MAG: hypothetical protein LLG01_19800 [Planctomycetaceae bacterium]|nr:hypothetical protein [Planctomycetaceae bacterium]
MPLARSDNLCGTGDTPMPHHIGFLEFSNNAQADPIDQSPTQGSDILSYRFNQSSQDIADLRFLP